MMRYILDLLNIWYEFFDFDSRSPCRECSIVYLRQFFFRLRRAIKSSHVLFQFTKISSTSFILRHIWLTPLLCAKNTPPAQKHPPRKHHRQESKFENTKKAYFKEKIALLVASLGGFNPIFFLKLVVGFRRSDVRGRGSRLKR